VLGILSQNGVLMYLMFKGGRGEGAYAITAGGGERGGWTLCVSPAVWHQSVQLPARDGATISVRFLQATVRVL